MIPNSNSKERQDYFYDKICHDKFEVNYTFLTSKYKENVATFYVFEDDLKVDGVRINVTAEFQQKIADLLGCMLLTAKLADLIFTQADMKITPCPRQISDSTKSMIEHSKDVDKKIEKANLKLLSTSAHLTASTGKHWILDNNCPINKVTNYGWHFTGSVFQGIKGSLPVTKIYNVRMIQGRGTHHNKYHTDYSQTCRLISRNCIINGAKMDLKDVLKDTELAYLANHDGFLIRDRIE